MIVLQYSSSEEIASAVIRHITHSKYSHVDAWIPGRGLIGSSSSPGVPVVEGNPNGVAIRKRDYQGFAYRNVAYLNCIPSVEAKFFELALSQLGKPFDQEAINSFLNVESARQRDWRAEHAWFCSEYLLWCLEQASFFPFEIIIAKDRIAPPDLLLITNYAMNNAHTFLTDTILSD